MVVSFGAAREAPAATGDCGQPLSAGIAPTATDALFILNVAVGFSTCELCTCDTDDSGTTTATDALRTLSAAVGVSVEFACPSCEPVSLCDALLLGVASGEPFDTIDIGDVPNGNDSVWAVVTPSVGDDALAGVLLDDSTTDYLMVPLHPDGYLVGGTVAVAITDGVEICPIGSLEILPLPTAPADTSANALAAFLALLDAAAADFGLTGAALATTPLNELPSQLLPLALAQIVLAGPGNANSLEALLAGTAPDAADGLDTDLLNRALAKIGLEAALQERLANRALLVPGASFTRRVRDLPAPQQGPGCVDLEPADFEINTAQELSNYMLEGLAARNGQSDISNQVVDDGLSMLFTLVGLVSPPVGAAGGAAVFAWNLYEEAAGSLYPSILTNIDFQIESGGRIPEDRMDGGDGAMAPFPEWSNPQLHATNTGMELTRTSIELLLTIVNFIPVPGGLGAELLKAGSLGAANDSLDDLGEQDCWTIPPTAWGPIGDARDPKFVEPLYFGDSVEQVLFEFFQPIALGTTQLRLRTKSDAFSGPSISEEKNIEVVRNRVTIQTPTVTVKPGGPVEIVATVSDSYRPEELDWEYPAFILLPDIEPPAGNMHTIRFDSPTERDRFPFEVRAISTSLKLDPMTPERDAKAQVKTESGVMITPRGGCVMNDMQQVFTVEVTGLADTEDDSISWNHSGGGMLVPGENNTATYTAPSSGMGEVTVTATLNLDNEVQDEVVIPYGACAINLDVGWHATSDNFDPDLEADIDFAKSAYFSGPLFPQDGDLLMPPASWWNGRSQAVATENGSTYLQPVFDDMGAKHDLPLMSSSQIEAELTSEGGGAAAMSMTWSTSAECKAIPNSAEGIECSNSTAQFSWNPVVWIEVSEPGTYNAQFTLSCNGGGPDGLALVGASTGIFRHVGGAAKGIFPNGGVGDPLYVNALNPFGAPDPPSVPIPISARNFVCEPGVPIVAQTTFELKGPTNPPKPDIVALVITVGSYLFSPVDPFVVVDPAAGSYSQSGSMFGSVTLARVGS